MQELLWPVLPAARLVSEVLTPCPGLLVEKGAVFDGILPVYGVQFGGKTTTGSLEGE